MRMSESNIEINDKNSSKSKNQSLIQVPNILIDNENIDSGTTMMYVYLKCKSYDGNTLITINKIKDDLIISRNTVIRKLSLLQDMKLIEYELNGQKAMNIKFLKYKQFTQLSRSSIICIMDNLVSINIKGEYKNLVSQGVRLYYYYEKNYNISYGYAYPQIRKIGEKCKMSQNTVILLNSLLETLELLRVEKGGYYQNELGEIRKENNKYTCLWKGARQLYEYRGK